MSVITISRGSYSHGKAIAEKVANKLGYECIAREILLEASKDYNIPELKLFHAINDAPSILDYCIYGKEKYIAYIQAALLEHLQKDNVVYHGFAGHFFVKDIPHILKVRIIADLKDRVRIVRERNGVLRKKALQLIKKLDRQRKKWGKRLYGIDTLDSSNYDLVIHVERITEEDAADIICRTVELEHFKTTSGSRQAMDDLSLAARVKAALIKMKPDIDVSAQKGVVHIKTETLESEEQKLCKDMTKIVETIPGVKDVNIHVLPINNM